MDTAMVIDLARHALWTAVLVSAPLLLIALVVGVLIGVIQAATSINEQTLSFLPRLVVTLLALGAGAHWGLQSLMDFFQLMVSQIPEVVG